MPLHNIRYVVAAVRNFRVKSNSNVFTRRASMLNYAKTRQRWWIHVEFDSDIDLFIFEKALGGSEVCLVELEDKFYVEDLRRPDSADVGQATRLAETVIAQLNGATRILCQHFHAVEYTESHNFCHVDFHYLALNGSQRATGWRLPPQL